MEKVKFLEDVVVEQISAGITASATLVNSSASVAIQSVATKKVTPIMSSSSLLDRAGTK